MKIFVSGSLAYDRIMDFPGRFSDHILPDKIHILNVSFTVGGLKEKFGGTAGNIAYNLALLGEYPTILAAVGDDFDRYEKRLTKFGLTLDGIKPIPGVLTSGAYITTDKSDNQITAFNPGAMAFPSKFQFNGQNPDQVLAIIAAGNLEDMLEFSRTYKDLKIKYIFDPGQSLPAWTPGDLSEIITGADMLISNDYELELIKKATRWDQDRLLERVGVLVTTLGEKGSQVITRADTISIPAIPARQVVDPTGAGDAYRSGLIKGLVNGKPMAEAALMGAACASFAVERLGTQEHHFTPEEFEKRLDQGRAPA